MKSYADMIPQTDKGFNYPCLVVFENENTHVVVLALHYTDDAEGTAYETFAGVVVHDFRCEEGDMNCRVGEFATNFTRRSYKPYSGTVKLKN